MFAGLKSFTLTNKSLIEILTQLKARKTTKRRYKNVTKCKPKFIAHFSYTTCCRFLNFYTCFKAYSGAFHLNMQDQSNPANTTHLCEASKQLCSNLFYKFLKKSLKKFCASRLLGHSKCVCRKQVIFQEILCQCFLIF